MTRYFGRVFGWNQKDDIVHRVAFLALDVLLFLSNSGAGHFADQIATLVKCQVQPP